MSVTVEQRLRWYERILQISRKASDESLESICRYLMDDAISAAQAQLGYLLFVDSKGQLKVVYARNEAREDIKKSDQHFSESIIRRALEMQAPLILDDAQAHPEFKQAKSVIVGQLKSVLVLPLFVEKKNFGVIYLENRNQAQFFAPELLEFLTLFSTQAAVLLYPKLSFHSISSSTASASHVVSKNQKMQKAVQQLEAAAKTESNVLILGETGTGKELMARRLHEKSSHSDKNFVPINCTAIPETLMESELFGYKKGAFTGAVADREGLVAKAHQGTLFLDEIGDLPLHLQAKLLRVIQEKKYTRLGGNTEEMSDFRLVSATHRSLDELVEQGFFRQDLFFRINTISIELPPLRERPEDILDLAQEFLSDAASQSKRSVSGFDEQASSLLLQHDWPGNIRQLQNAIQRAVALVEEDRSDHRLTAKDFQFLAKNPQAPSAGALTKLQEAKEEFIRGYVKKAILIHKGNKTKAAKALGVDPKTLYRHLLHDEDAGED